MADLHEQYAIHPFPELRGHGLRLRSWDAESDVDVATWLRGLSDPEFQRWNTPLKFIRDIDGARESLRARAESAERGTAVAFCVTDADTGTPLGHIGVNDIDYVAGCARVGYWVLPEARGRKVATRALLLAARYAFTDLALHRLELGHAVGHDLSCRVAERCGFAYEGTLRGAMFAAGRHDAFRDVHLHGRLATDPEPTAPDLAEGRLR
ncbi:MULTISPECIES: GNAT family N-acetyltransferase [Streptomyces]|uniref:N-acetyltransferase n=1 Tax=Streptomyces dengpaensis TaxID=2049881 RepID=A0ABM6SUM7_9ACTN|nr:MULTISPECIES: GNAT family N-acetyltransferase [Streptomyces]AVH58125.1 N-acetyltransferase [Streptomyces dengpaensis]PIB06217.1 GNAT family N-acetyltransferase [Streptomyces sp. HG99]